MIFSFLAWGQASDRYKGEYANFYRGEELYEKAQYGAAREVFSEFTKSFQDVQDPMYVKARYYEGMAALELFNGDAIKLLMEFNNEYPESIYKNTIFFKIGENYYQSKKYKDAKEWLDKTDPKELDTAQLATYHFKLGYANFQLEDYASARNEFYEIKDGKSNYSDPALYYYSHIAYKNKAYQEALDGFLKLQNNSAFQKEVGYYIVQIYYLMGNYKKVAELAPEYTNNDNGIEKNTAEMNLLIGDAYYRVQKYDEAVAYLEDYNKRKETTRDQDYALAYSYLKSKQYDNAVKLFNRVTKENDALTQAAYYHIAQAYIEKEELNYARAAFKSASDVDFDIKIQEDALYNYAVLSYKVDYNPYNESIKAFELYLAKFPNSDKTENIYNYMVNVYSSTKNYEEALKSLDRIPNKNIKLKTAYQIVSFNMGIEKYERGDYTKCIEILKGVNKYDVNPMITAKAKFWSADANYMLKSWSAAINGYRDFLLVPGMNDLQLKENAYYNIAYAYFMQKDWVQAIQAFRTYTQLSNIKDKARLGDAYTRLGDCYFTKDDPDFQKSAMNYENALSYDGIQKDEVLYSLSKVYRLMPAKREAQITTLEKLLKDYPKSNFVIPALFDIASGYKNEGKYTDALINFNKIIQDYPSNILVKDALIEIADIKFKQKNYQESESYFRRVLKEFALDDVTCKRVTKGIVDIYRATRQQDKIVALGKEFPCAEISSDDEEIFFYETANELYVNEKYNEAITEINKYLKNFPDGRFAIQLTSYLADIYYQRDDQEEAVLYYSKIIEKPNSPYTEEALIRSSKILFNNEQYDQALPYYEKLIKLTSNSQVIYNTQLGLMRCYYLLEDYTKAADYASKVLENELLKDKELQEISNYIAGVSYFKSDQLQKSLSYLRWTADKISNERGMEALYLLAEANYLLKDYVNAEKLHNELMNRKPMDAVWMGRSFILQAKVFMAVDDLFQAEQTINIVIEKYPNSDDGIKEEAQSVKEEILQLKETPKDVEDNINRMIDMNDEDNE
ncbi:MAG: tetratricopeptide repeat protein [Brumimicrobium sp.]|nr:tetratricopeptide repeat protein [Brumimicrobium sp.]MCO5267790.1 tetratricopeptide repeat protein [Brumimicrobium sp.]